MIKAERSQNASAHVDTWREYGELSNNHNSHTKHHKHDNVLLLLSQHDKSSMTFGTRKQARQMLVAVLEKGQHKEHQISRMN